MLVGRLVGCAAAAGVGLSSPLFADHSALKSTQRTNTPSSSSIVCSRSTAHISVFCEFSLLLLLEQSVDDANTELKPPLPSSPTAAVETEPGYTRPPAGRLWTRDVDRLSPSTPSSLSAPSSVRPFALLPPATLNCEGRTVRGGEGRSARRASARNYSLHRCTIR